MRIRGRATNRNKKYEITLPQVRAPRLKTIGIANPPVMHLSREYCTHSKGKATNPITPQNIATTIGATKGAFRLARTIGIIVVKILRKILFPRFCWHPNYARPGQIAQ